MVLRSQKMIGGKGKVSEDDGSFDRAFWRQATPEERMTAMFGNNILGSPTDNPCWSRLKLLVVSDAKTWLILVNLVLVKST